MNTQNSNTPTPPLSFQQEIDKEIKEKNLYFVGDALPPDWYAALKIFINIAEQNDVRAQYNVGRCYQVGHGTEVDLEKAKIWFSKAIENGETRSFFRLFEILTKSTSTNEKNAAEEYLNSAIEANDPHALKLSSQRNKNKENQEKKQRENEAKEYEIKIFTEIQEALKSGGKESAISISKSHAKTEYDLATYLLDLLSIQITRLQIHGEKTTHHFDGGTIEGTSRTLSRDTYSYSITLDANITSNSKATVNSFELYIPYSTKDKKNGDLVDKCRFYFPKQDIKNNKITVTRSGFSAKPVLNNECHIKFSFNNTNYELNIPFPVNQVVSATGDREGCFVVTACYGNYDHPTVIEFRRFRDGHLLKSPTGKYLVKTYYKVSPPIASLIEKSPKIKFVLGEVFRIIAKTLPKN